MTAMVLSHLNMWYWLLQYASLATQIGTAAMAEAPVRALKAISPNITKKRVPKPVLAERCASTFAAFHSTAHF